MPPAKPSLASAINTANTDLTLRRPLAKSETMPPTVVPPVSPRAPKSPFQGQKGMRGSHPSVSSNPDDPYDYMAGFGNGGLLDC